MNNEDHFMVKGPLAENWSLQTDEDLIYQGFLHVTISYFSFALFYNILKNLQHMTPVLQEIYMEKKYFWYTLRSDSKESKKKEVGKKEMEN